MTSLSTAAERIYTIEITATETELLSLSRAMQNGATIISKNCPIKLRESRDQLRSLAQFLDNSPRQNGQTYTVNST